MYILTFLMYLKFKLIDSFNFDILNANISRINACLSLIGVLQIDQTEIYPPPVLSKSDQWW